MSQCTKPDALKVQVGGGHYAKLKIQPVEFIMENQWDFCAGSVVKYLTRYRDKNGRQDLEKAKHFVQLRQASLSRAHRHGQRPLPRAARDPDGARDLGPA